MHERASGYPLLAGSCLHPGQARSKHKRTASRSKAASPPGSHPSAVALLGLSRRAEATTLLRDGTGAWINNQRALRRVHGTGGQDGDQGSAANDAQDSSHGNLSKRIADGGGEELWCPDREQARSEGKEKDRRCSGASRRLCPPRSCCPIAVAAQSATSAYGRKQPSIARKHLRGQRIGVTDKVALGALVEDRPAKPPIGKEQP